MSRRNLILLIIILGIVVVATVGYLYFRARGTTPGETPGGTNFIDQFNPFGGGTPTPPKETPPADVSGYVPPGEEIQDTKLRKVSSMPIAGFASFTKERIKIEQIEPVRQKTEFVTALRYVDRATGNIFQTFADKIEEWKFSKTVIPKIYEAYFGNRAESVVMRYLKPDEETIQTFIGTLPKELVGTQATRDNEVKGVFLPDNIKDVSVSPDTSKLFYLFNQGENATGITLNFVDQRKNQIFQNAFTEWNSFWPNMRIITLTTKPSAGVPGYMYNLDPISKKFSQVMGGVNGLTTLMSPNGKIALYGDSNLSLSIYDTSTKASSAAGVRTLPEKCVWGKNSDVIYCAVPKTIPPGLYPDSWYQGEISFLDQLWKIELKTGKTTLLVDPASSAGGEDMDAIKLALDEAENYLFFVNKKNSIPWELQLK